MARIRLVVGLGNPGPKYENTRHNIGFLVLQAYAQQLGWTFREERRFNGRVAKGQVEGETVCLLMPDTYMNESGTAVRKAMDFYKWEPQQVLVVMDDVAFQLGDLRLKDRGSAGGHNGLKSIQTHLGTQEVPRLRMGIGGKGQKTLTGHVLGRFGREDGELLVPVLQKGMEVIHRLLRGEDLQQVMNQVNRRKREESGKTKEQPQSSEGADRLEETSHEKRQEMSNGERNT